MTRREVHGIVHESGLRHRMLRVLLFVILGLFAVYYLMPLLVMIATALKPLDEIRTGTLLSPPREPTFEPAMRAWESASVCRDAQL